MSSATATPARRPVAEDRPSPAPGARRPNLQVRSRLFGPGWPLTALFLFYPVWWLLGVSQFFAVLVGVPLVFELIRRRRVRVPRSFGVWLLFLAWIVVGVVVLQADAPGAIPENSATRYLTFAFRLTWYLTGTMVLLYVGNTDHELPNRRVADILGYMFPTIVLGGFLGAILPDVTFPSLLEVVLPASLTDITFVHALIHPLLAQLQDILDVGVSSPRPSAPFANANEWGINYACFLPFFVLSWLRRDAGWRRYAAPPLLLLSIYPLIKTLDRGAWIALIMMAVVVVAKSALAGRTRAVVGLVAAAAVTAGLLAFSPIGTTISERIAHPHSNQGRKNLAELTVRSALAGSPIVGFGSTRNVQGNFNSINGGATPDCPHCSPPALGTQGQLWLVIFSQGPVGALLYLAFFVLVLLQHIRRRSRYATLGLAVMVAMFVTLPVYTHLGTAFIAIMVAMGLLWRAGSADEPDVLEPSVGGYASFLRQQAVPVVAFVVIGTLGGAAWQVHRGPEYTSSISILVPAEVDYGNQAERPLTLDSDAQFVGAPQVTAAVAAAAGGSLARDDPGVAVSASPNTRVLHLAYTANDPGTADRVVTAAARAYLGVRATHLEDRKTAELARLRVRSTELAKATSQLTATVGDLNPRNGEDVSGAQVRPLKAKLAALTARSRTVDKVLAMVGSDPLDTGRIVQPATAKLTGDGWVLFLSSGFVLGLFAGCVVGYARHLRSGRIRDPRRAALLTGLPVITEMTVPQRDGGLSGTEVDARLAARIHRPIACLSVRRDQEPATRALTARLEAARPARLAEDPAVGTRRRSVVLVASPRTRAKEVTHLEESLRAAGSNVSGVVLAGSGVHRRGLFTFDDPNGED